MMQDVALRQWTRTDAAAERSQSCVAMKLVGRECAEEIGLRLIDASRVGCVDDIARGGAEWVPSESVNSEPDSCFHGRARHEACVANVKTVLRPCYERTMNRSETGVLEAILDAILDAIVHAVLWRA